MFLGTGWGATGIGYKRPQGQLNGICKLFPTIRRDHQATRTCRDA
jgi:hypothetical protein